MMNSMPDVLSATQAMQTDRDIIAAETLGGTVSSSQDTMQ
jgi:hypothetical protein